MEAERRGDSENFGEGGVRTASGPCASVKTSTARGRGERTKAARGGKVAGKWGWGGVQCSRELDFYPTSGEHGRLVVWKKQERGEQKKWEGRGLTGEETGKSSCTANRRCRDSSLRGIWFITVMS